MRGRSSWRPFAGRLPVHDMGGAAVSSAGFARASGLLRRHVEDLERPAEFRLLEREWDLLPGVFAPIYTPGTELFTSWLPYPVGGDFLEVGCGAGVTAVMAALAGCRQVTA